MYLKQSVKKPQGNKSPGASAPKDPNVTVVFVEDILSFPERNGSGVLMEGSFAMKPNTQMIQVYMTPSTIDASFETEGEEDAEQFKHKFQGDHPGDELEINEFIQNVTGRDCVLLFGSCSDSFKKVMGSKCAPMKLKANGQDNKDGRKKTMVWEQSVATGYVPGQYVGEIVLEEIAIASSSALTISNTTLIQRLPASATTSPVTVTANTADSGKVVTLIGSGGANPPTLASSETIILKNGASWVALENAVIHLQVFEGSTKMLIEMSRE